jgi:hypothetical protein
MSSIVNGLSDQQIIDAAPEFQDSDNEIWNERIEEIESDLPIKESREKLEYLCNIFSLRAQDMKILLDETHHPKEGQTEEEYILWRKRSLSFFRLCVRCQGQASFYLRVLNRAENDNRVKNKQKSRAAACDVDLERKYFKDQLKAKEENYAKGRAKMLESLQEKIENLERLKAAIFQHRYDYEMSKNISFAKANEKLWSNIHPKSWEKVGYSALKDDGDSDLYQWRLDQAQS